jgi:hypothetical protein
MKPPLVFYVDRKLAFAALPSLTAARQLLTSRTWTQGTFAVNADGVTVPPKSPTAVRWCAMGALERFSARTVVGLARHNAALTLLAAGTRAGNVAAWQDRRGRTVREVRAAFAKAIRLADAAGP